MNITMTQEYKDAFNTYRKAHTAMLKTESKTVHKKYTEAVIALNKITKGC
jgi:hypothetical protein